ncbi:class I SAM-dependent methyltransferase [Hoeflea ulvae]|uniref:Class I SAM-dependent methyltransferase n=1 Tax=Hoeflea ulvae TaxID=2983764 RepID=A0ABT3YEV5_9HYPH|nr:class I SAM-dependent methyltransferase [Hoeflea ulvae]MCY0094435.1 class I SAM-dependent methyltransferase [Hoeflea ulvae]
MTAGVTATDEVLAGYAGLGADWIARSDGLSCDEIYAPVTDLLPDEPSRVLDLGAATGRDVAWLAARGHKVVAVEPVSELREAGQRLHPLEAVEWRDDRLPRLERIGASEMFDCVLANGVLHHLEPDAQEASIRRLAGMLRPGGLLIASLRHGVGPKGRQAWPMDVAALVTVAQTSGMELIRRVDKGSVQPENQNAGITWTWLVLRRGELPGMTDG